MTKSVHLLWFVKEMPEQDVRLLIGIYSSRDQASSAIQRLCSLPGFKVFPDAFQVQVFPLNKDHWSDGFIANGFAS